MDIIYNIEKYLSDAKVRIDFNEFRFQCKSHPDYPSLLSIIDALTFFNLKCEVFDIDDLHLDLLPDKFIARLKGRKGEFFVYPVFYISSLFLSKLQDLTC